MSDTRPEETQTEKGTVSELSDEDSAFSLADISLGGLFELVVVGAIVLSLVSLAFSVSSGDHRARAYFMQEYSTLASEASPCFYLHQGIRREGKCVVVGPYNVMTAGGELFISREKMNGEVSLLAGLNFAGGRFFAEELVDYSDKNTVN